MILTFHKLPFLGLEERIKSSTDLTLKELKELINSSHSAEKKPHILIDTPCNAKCNHCYFPKRNESSQVQIEIDQIKEFIEKTNFEYIYIREPLGNPEMLKLLIGTSQNSIMTNGRLNFDKINFWELLNNVGVKEITFGIPGDMKTYQEVYNGTSDEYQIVLNNILESRKNGFNTGTFSVFTHENCKNILETIELFACHGVNFMSFVPFIPMGKGKGLKKELFVDQKDLTEVIMQIEKGRKRYSKNNGNFIDLRLFYTAGPNFFDSKVFKFLKGDLEIKTEIGRIKYSSPGKICPAINGNNPAIILPENSVYPRFNTIEESELRGKDKLPLENLDSRLSGGLCQKCEEKDICLGGCRATAYHYAIAEKKENPLYQGQRFCVTPALKEILRH